MRIRSPGYPSVNLSQALEMTDKIFRMSRQNVLDREAAAKDIGYSGLTGQSAKMLADLSHFGLIEKAGKGGLRVTDLAVQALHPRSPTERVNALNTAGYYPALYNQIRNQWPDGFVSENALRGYLMREGFSSSAVAPALSSFFETYRFLQQEAATESHGPPHSSAHDGDAAVNELAAAEAPPVAEGASASIGDASRQRIKVSGVSLMEGERVVFVEEGGPASYLKLVASGELDETMIEALEDYIKRQKKRLNATKPN